MKIETNGYIHGGRLVLMNRMRFDQDIKLSPDGDVVVTVRKRGKRSAEQNRYYWGVVIKEITLRFQELGNEVTPEIVHDYLKGEFNLVVAVLPNGDEVKMPNTTTDLNKEEFFIYTELIKRWAAETLQIYIPDPGTQTEMQL